LRGIGRKLKTADRSGKRRWGKDARGPSKKKKGDDIGEMEEAYRIIAYTQLRRPSPRKGEGSKKEG